MNDLFPPPPKPPPPREDYGAEEDRRHFRRNLIAVAIGHALLLAALFFAGIFHPKPKPPEVMWLSEGALGGGDNAPAAAPETPPDPVPEMVEPDPPKPEPQEKIPDLPPPPVEEPVKSDIAEPKATPPPATPKPATPKPATPKPSTPKATPKATPKPKPKETPKVAPKKDTTPKPKSDSSPKPNSETSKKATDKPSTSKKDGEKSDGATARTGTKSGTNNGGAGEGTGKGKTGTGKDAMSDFGWYTDMLHDRYYSRWFQPVGLGEDVVATVKLRIMKDGTIAKHDLVKSSGNPQMDESVMAAVEKVKQIDPLPAGLGNGEYFDLNVAFKVGG